MHFRGGGALPFALKTDYDGPCTQELQYEKSYDGCEEGVRGGQGSDELLKYTELLLSLHTFSPLYNHRIAHRVGASNQILGGSHA